MTPVLERLQGGTPPFPDYWRERAVTLGAPTARTMIHDARTVLRQNGMPGLRYVELDGLLQGLLQLDRLRETEVDIARVPNGSRT